MAHPTPQYGQTESTALVSDSGASIVSALLNSAPVGHTAAHSPHDTQVDSPMGRLRSKPIWVSAPLPVRPMTSLFWISSQPRIQRSHRMQAWWLTEMTFDEASFGRPLPRGKDAPFAPYRRASAWSSLSPVVVSLGQTSGWSLIKSS